jgi:hypothetical protein
MGTSQDLNADGIPDECEDANHNGILDSIDIAMGTSLDLNANGIPDEAEPDCNGNGVPDDRDIALGTSRDQWGDGVPDECDADVNHNGQSDYNEIMADMTLDKNRNRILDAVEDCDHNGVPDLVALDGSHFGWTASLAPENAIRQYHPVTGVLTAVSALNTVSQAQDLIITADRRILVSSGDTNRIVEFDHTGALVRTLVAPGSGGLTSPRQMLVTPTNTLLVASRATSSILEYDLATGAFLRALVPAGSSGLSLPFGLTRGPSGHLFVSCGDNRVLEFDLSTGAFIRVVVAAGAGGLADPRGLIFNPFDGTLLVASYTTNQVKQYDPTSGAYLRDWLITSLHTDGAWCLRVGPDRMIYMSHSILADTHLTRARIYIFDPRNGNFVRAYVQAQDSGLDSPTGFDFMPDAGTDCNHNAYPDNCDIARGYSADVNGNGIPDECERSCPANCDLSTAPPILNVNDFVCFQAAFITALGLPTERQITHYANCDGSITPPVLNVNDFICFQTRFAAGCP